MTKDVLVVDGPDKPGLQWAVTYPERNVRVHFNTDDDIFDASVVEMEELEDGLSFRLTGAIETGAFREAGRSKVSTASAHATAC